MMIDFNFFFFENYMFTLFLSIFVAILFSVHIWLTNSYNYFEKLGLPYEKPKFLIGNLRNYPFLFKNKHQFYFVEKIYHKYSNEAYVGMFKLRKPMLMVRDPVICNDIMTKYFENFQNRPGPPVDEKKNPLSNHLINLQGTKWKNVRTKLSPVFTSLKLKKMYNGLNECIKKLITHLEENVSENRSEFEFIQLLAKFDLTVSGKCIFGLDTDALDNPHSDYSKVCAKLFKPSVTSKYKQIFYFLFPNLFGYTETKNVTNETINFFRHILNKAIKETEYRESNDFLNTLIDLKKTANDTTEVQKEIESILNLKQDKNLITDSIIMSNLAVFFTTGYESTASTIASVLYELALNPIVQDKLRKELHDFNEEETLSYNTIMQLKFLHHVIWESQRLHPVNTSLSRQCTGQKFKLPGTQIFIEPGTHVCIPTFAMYKDPKYFDEPNTFNPDRFSEVPDKNNDKNNLKMVIPFGEGPRQCIAKTFSLMEVKVAVSHLILNFKFHICQKTDIPLTFLPDKLFITPSNGIWLRLEKIKSSSII